MRMHKLVIFFLTVISLQIFGVNYKVTGNKLFCHLAKLKNNITSKNLVDKYYKIIYNKYTYNKRRKYYGI